MFFENTMFWEEFPKNCFSIFFLPNLFSISVTNSPEVPFLFQTQFTYVVDKYKKEYVLEKQNKKKI